ncbi:MAG: alanyl-tRNA editing protein [Kofleriaceae bacterium]
MSTERLYFESSYQRVFDARVVALTSWRDQPAVVLDRTCFYPEAGGQLGDRGALGGVLVSDTQVDDDGVVYHVLASAEGGAPERGELTIGATVRGELDWARRRQHMAQHTAQHLLSGALLDRAEAPTASARLGESALTIDVARDRIPEAELAAAEELANALIDDDLPVRAWFPDAAELASLKLRRDPKVDANIRVVAIGDFDRSPCGGTHCASTAELGAVRVTGVERYKGMTRVTFMAARRGRLELFRHDQVLRQLSVALSCQPTEVPAALDKLRRAHDEQGAELTAVRGRLASAVAASFAGDGAVVATLPSEPELVRAVAAKLTAAGRDALLYAPDDAGAAMVVLARAPGSSLDCGALWKQLAARVGGRGGGRADRAEGRLSAPCAWSELLAELQAGR